MRVRLDQMRGVLEGDSGELPEFESDEYTNLLRADLLARRVGSLKSVVNATGIVIHTNLGRAPLADQAIEAIADVARGYSNLEYEIESGQRGSRNSHIEALLCELTGAEAALVLNNCAAAVLLALRCFAESGEVVVSRGELIEIGGSFRMPDVIAQSGARMVEVGTTNRTRVSDYTNALTEETRVLLTSHPSNYRIVGFTEAPEPSELAALAREQGLVLVQDLGSGSLVSLDQLSADEPTVAECIGGGADVVTFSGDKLLGGPQAGIVVGRAELLDQLRRHPMARAMRIDKLSLAGLTATLRLYRPPHDPLEQVPVLRMLAESNATITRRSKRFARKLNGLDKVTATVVDGVGYAGGGALPMHELKSCLIRLEVSGYSSRQLAECLRRAAVPIIARITDDAVHLDLRTVLPRQLKELADQVRDAIA